MRVGDGVESGMVWIRWGDVGPGKSEMDVVDEGDGKWGDVGRKVGVETYNEQICTT
jgi:hypothetical protein